MCVCALCLEKIKPRGSVDADYYYWLRYAVQLQTFVGSFVHILVLITITIGRRLSDR